MEIGTEIAGYKIHPAAQKFPPMRDEEFEALCADIAANELCEPVTLCEYEGETVILDGRHRFLACLKCGKKLAKTDFFTYKGKKQVDYVVSRNKHRRHLTPSQLAMIAADLKPMYEAEAEKRRLANLKKGEEGPERATRPTREGDESDDDDKQEQRSRDQAGADMGASGRSVARAEKVIAGGCDELQKAVRNGLINVTIGEKLAARSIDEQRQILEKIKESPKKNPKAILRQHDKDKLIERIEKEPRPSLKGPFRVIVVDPPWQYFKRKGDGTQRGQTPYPTMTIDEILELEQMLNEVAHKDCILWLWTTNAHLPIAFNVLEVWDFDYKTCLTWVKPKMGTGDWLRGMTEHCLMAARGEPGRNLKNQTTFISGDVREHSRKPEAFYQLVEGLCPGAKLEMFATEPRKNWQIWAPGNWREEIAAGE